MPPLSALKADTWTVFAATTGPNGFPRKYDTVFRSGSPQRRDPAPWREGVPKFDRSLARVLGPGTYDPKRSSEFTETDKQLSSFSNTLPQRTGAKAFTSDIDLAHGKDPGNTALLLNKALHSTAPGASGQRWTKSPRKEPYFHPQRINVDVYYDQERNTVDQSVKQSGRQYGSSFHTGVSRLSQTRMGTSQNLGPGSYNDTFPVTSSVREPFRNSSTFAPRVGGKFAHVVGRP